MAAEICSDTRASKSVEQGEHLDAQNQLLNVLEDSLDNGPKPLDSVLLEPASGPEQHQIGGEVVVAHSGALSQNVVEEAISDATNGGVQIGDGHTGSGISHDAEERNALEEGKEPEVSGSVSGPSQIDDTAVDSGIRIDVEQERNASGFAEMESRMANSTENPIHKADDSIDPERRAVEEKLVLDRDLETTKGSTSSSGLGEVIDHVETETGIDQTRSSSDVLLLTEDILKVVGTPARTPASEAYFKEEQTSKVDYHANEEARSGAALTTVVSMDLEGWHRFDDADGGADPSRAGAPRQSVELWEQLLDSGLDSAPQVVTEIGGSESRSARTQELDLASPGNPFANGAVRLSDFSDWDEFAFHGNPPNLADLAASHGFGSSPSALPFGAGPYPVDQAQELSKPVSLHRRRDLSFSDSLNIIDGGDKWEANFDSVVVVAAPPAQQMMSSVQSRPQQILPPPAKDADSSYAARARASSSFRDLEPKLRPSLMKKVVDKARALQVLSSSPLEGAERDQKSVLGHCFCW